MNKYFLSDKDSKNASLKRQIIKLCIEAGSYSIAELSSRINSSVPTVTKLINELITESPSWNTLCGNTFCKSWANKALPEGAGLPFSA